MIRETVNALAACLVTFALCAVAYPVAVWGVAWLAFPHQAGGSLIERDGKTIGSALVAQPFASDTYFQPRPSAVDYKADATGGSNLGTKNPDLRTKVAERAQALKATAENPAPTDLVSASGGGLDPDITPEAARYQAARIASARKIPVKQVHDLIESHTERSGAIIGAPARINVLRLNLDLDEAAPADAAPAPSDAKAEPAPAPGDSAATPKAAEPPAPAPDDLLAFRSQLGALTERVAQLGKAVDAIPPPSPSEVKGLEQRVETLSEKVALVAPLVARVDDLGQRLKTADDHLGALRTDLGQVRDALKALAEKAEERAKPSSRADLAPGLELFGKGRYADAAQAFRSQADEHPDDARPWYLAAVARGLATSTWTGETEVMVNKGVDREKLGTPAPAEIDAAVAGLTTATGRDWLSFYRQRARP